jgi:hypothetical protein
MPQPVVGIVGMAALRRDLNRLADNTKGPLFQALKAAGLAAVAPIVPAVRQRLPQGGTGRLAASVRASGTRTGGSVRMGSASVPYAGPVEFGGYPGGRPFIPAGRYLFPAAVDDATRAANTYSQALTRLFALDDLWTNTTSSGGAVHD